MGWISSRVWSGRVLLIYLWHQRGIACTELRAAGGSELLKLIIVSKIDVFWTAPYCSTELVNVEKPVCSLAETGHCASFVGSP